MFGFRDEFTYFECHECGCLQIKEIPKDMARYYPSNYHSLSPRNAASLMERFIEARRDRYVMFNTGFVHKLLCISPRIVQLFRRSSLNRKYPSIFDSILKAIGGTEVRFVSSILDVGCGSGGLLYALRNMGFKHLVGVDPIIIKEVQHKGIKILKKTIHDLPGNKKFDLIIFNHSLEHIFDQLQTLVKVSEVLEDNGICVIRMPIKTEAIWHLYGVDWVQIDAPRHFFIHTMKSFKLLAKQAGLVINDVFFDSSEFQFWGSEQYKNDIPLRAENSYLVNPEKSIFTEEQVAEFAEVAKGLNDAKQGDQAAFYLIRDVG